MPARGHDYVPFAVESYSRLGASAQSFLTALGDVAAAPGAISKADLVWNTYREVSCALQRGLGLLCRRSFNISRPGVRVAVHAGS
jgi:hypothetical protein